MKKRKEDKGEVIENRGGKDKKAYGEFTSGSLG